MDVNIPLVIKTVLEDYALPLNGEHGVAHWARVLEIPKSKQDDGERINLTYRKITEPA